MKIALNILALGIISALLTAFSLRGPSAEDYFESGKQKFNSKDYSGAIADFTIAIKQKPDFAIVYFKRGSAFYLTMDFDKAYEEAHEYERN